MSTSTGRARVSSSGPVLGRHEVIDAGHLAGGVDVLDAARHRIHLGRAQCAAQGLDLAVDVGLGDVVEIDEHDLRHAATRQRLGSPGTDTADPDDGHARGAHLFVGRTAPQSAQPAEAALQIGLPTQPGVRRLQGGGRVRLAHLSWASRSLPATAASEFG
jgi:hypothetical protein